MKYRTIYQAALCGILALSLLTGTACRRSAPETSSVEMNASTEPQVFEMKAGMNESASFGGMTLTVSAAEDSGETMDSGNKAVFFYVTLDNESGETVTASYLNNFTLSVDGTYYEADQCCTIPAMHCLYTTHNEPALNKEVENGTSVSGYVACEVKPGFSNVELHYIPKTTDRTSRITVPIASSDFIAAK